mmetsp:Transcript_15029/g.28740  ORF Transcript_15029/g.28740 Transcript_15029/m.28740 type:complete len:692 (+) Transcript_15029:267-2342(+)
MKKTTTATTTTTTTRLMHSKQRNTNAIGSHKRTKTNIIEKENNYHHMDDQSSSLETPPPPPPPSALGRSPLSRSDKKTTLATRSGRFSLRRRSSDDSSLELMKVSARHLSVEFFDDDEEEHGASIHPEIEIAIPLPPKVPPTSRRRDNHHENGDFSSLDDSIDFETAHCVPTSGHSIGFESTHSASTIDQIGFRSRHSRSDHQHNHMSLDDSGSISVDLSTDSVAVAVHQPKRFRRKSRRPPRRTDSSSTGKVRLTTRLIMTLLMLLFTVPIVMIHLGNEATKRINHKSSLEKHQERFKEEFKQDFSLEKRLPDPYTPALQPLSNVSSEFYHHNEPNSNTTVLHFVKSRFMQYQPNLTDLGWARLELFREFCLPSVLKQTTQNFIWLIYTDPDLHPDLLKAMSKLLAPYPNYYLIKSLSNSMWKGGQAVNMTQATIYTGNQARLEAAMALRDSLPILETRLDADDAIHVGYLEEVQKQAIPMFTQQSVQWMYWCVVQELEWNWVGPTAYSSEQKEYGIMESKPYIDFCPTPGLTLGMAAGTAVDTIYSRKHSVLVERLHTKEGDFCGPGRPGKDCYQVINKFEYPAFRCRTPTSASMVMSDYSNEAKLKKRAKADLTDKRWDILRESFGVPRSNVHKANDYLTRNILKIAEDAIMGQCTKGHSCSKTARKKLENVLDRYRSMNLTNVVVQV